MESNLGIPNGVDETEVRAEMRRAEPAPLKQLGAGLGIYLLAQFASTIIIAASTLTAGANAFDSAAAFTENPIAVSIALGASAVVSVVGFLVAVPRLTGRRAFELRGPRAWPELARGLLLGFAPMAVAVGILALLGVYRVSDVSLNVGLLTGLMIGVGAAFAEEIFFRGFLLRVLDKQFGSWAALIVVSLLFGALHLTNPGATVWGAIAITLVAGPLLNGAYLLTRRLWLPIGIHLAWNASQSGLFGINVSGVGTGRGLLEAELIGPVWLTGGSLGIEGSVVLVMLGTVAGVTVTLLAYKCGRMLPRRSRRGSIA